MASGGGTATLLLGALLVQGSENGCCASVRAVPHEGPHASGTHRALRPGAHSRLTTMRSFSELVHLWIFFFFLFWVTIPSRVRACRSQRESVGWWIPISSARGGRALRVRPQHPLDHLGSKGFGIRQGSGSRSPPKDSARRLRKSKNPDAVENAARLPQHYYYSCFRSAAKRGDNYPDTGGACVSHRSHRRLSRRKTARIIEGLIHARRARWAHNPKVGDSSPAAGTRSRARRKSLGSW